MPANTGPSGTPHHWTSPVKQLYCRHGYNLAINEDGCVYGTPEPYSKYAVLEFSSVAIGGVVRIKALATGFYVAMNEHGCLYGEKEAGEESTVFEERYDEATRYNTYLSRKYAHLGWYMAIRKTGHTKPGPKTAFNQKAVMFLPRPPTEQ